MPGICRGGGGRLKLRFKRYITGFYCIFMTIPSLILETSPTAEFLYILVAGSAASPEECQHLMEESDKQVKKLLEGFGTRCIHSKVDIVLHHTKLFSNWFHTQTDSSPDLSFVCLKYNEDSVNRSPATGP